MLRGRFVLSAGQICVEFFGDGRELIDYDTKSVFHQYVGRKVAGLARLLALHRAADINFSVIKIESISDSGDFHLLFAFCVFLSAG
jgi:hypothetical protein